MSPAALLDNRAEGVVDAIPVEAVEDAEDGDATEPLARVEELPVDAGSP